VVNHVQDTKIMKEITEKLKILKHDARKHIKYEETEVSAKQVVEEVQKYRAEPSTRFERSVNGNEKDTRKQRND